MILLFRSLPIAIALLNAFLFWIQTKQPGTYPTFVLIVALSVPVASLVLSFKKLRVADLVEKMLPTYVLLASLAFGLLLAEGPVAIGTIIALAAAASFVSLELLFLLIYHPSAYPVNGLSRVNIAYVPLAVWYAASTSSGLRIFLHVSPWIHIAILTALGAILFRTTNHPGASARQNAVWSAIGLLVGAEIGWIGLLLPVSMGMQGILAALLCTAALRARRYLYDPKPSRRLAWSEAMALLVLLAAALGTAKWL